MNSAVWLFVLVPQWYFATLAHPFEAGLVSLIPVGGIVCLAVGVIVGAVKRQWNLFRFAASVVISAAFVAAAGVLRDRLAEEIGLLVTFVFLVFQLVLVGYLVYRAKGARPAAIALALFCLSYALFTAFVAAMAFSNDWL